MTIAASVMAVVMFCCAMPFEAFAADDDTLQTGEQLLKERSATFTYGYTECTGEEHPASDRDIVCSESGDYPRHYSAQMMLCDTDHTVGVSGEGVTDSNVTITSSNPEVLSIESDGSVTLNSIGTAQIIAKIGADDTYAEATVYLYVRVSRHEGWIESGMQFADRPAEWGLKLDTSEGPHLLDLKLRPGARASFQSENSKIVSVDQDGMVTPLSAGTTQIWISIDDGGGRYTPCRFGWTVKVTGESLSLKERSVWLTYEYTDCAGEKHPPAAYEYNENYEDPANASVTMMLCDSDHKLYVAGDGVTDSNVTFTSLDNRVSIDRDGNVAFNSTGYMVLKATVAADSTYAEKNMYFGILVDKHDGWISPSQVHYEGRTAETGLDLDTSDSPQQLIVPLREGAGVSYQSRNENVAYVDEKGIVTPISPGTAEICFDVDGGERFKSGSFCRTINVTGKDTRRDQQITGDTGPFTIDVRDGLQLDLHAQTELTYTFAGEYGRISQSGYIEFTHAGTGTVTVTAKATKEYKEDTVSFKVTARDYEAEKAAEEEAARLAREEEERLAKEEEERLAKEEEERLAKEEEERLAKEEEERLAKEEEERLAKEEEERLAKEEEERLAREEEERLAKEEEERKAREEEEQKAAEEATLKEEIAKAKSLKRPKLSVKALKGRKIKLTWNKVANADGYIVYVKIPGRKKYVKAVKKKARVKSVTHRGLSRGRVYRYKVRAFKKVNGKTYYSPYSKVRKARVRR